MGSIIQAPSQVLSRITRYLPTQAECLAFSLTSRELQVAGETQLYRNVVFNLNDSSSDERRLEAFVRCLMTRQDRCSWVHSLSVTLSNRSLTRMEHKILAIIINILPSLRSFKYIDDSDNDDSVYHTAIDFHPPRHPLQAETSLRQFTCLNANILDQEPFLAFLHFHHGLQHLEFSEDVLNVPQLGKGILPNLETLRAPIDVILRLLPGRNIKRIKTAISEDMAPVWIHMPRTAFADVQVFSSTVRGDAEELLESLVLQMSNLEFLEIEVCSQGFPCVRSFVLRLICRTKHVSQLRFYAVPKSSFFDFATCGENFPHG